MQHSLDPIGLGTVINICMYISRRDVPTGNVVLNHEGYSDPFQGFPGREYSKVVDHSLLLGCPGTVQLAQGHPGWPDT